MLDKKTVTSLWVGLERKRCRQSIDWNELHCIASPPKQNYAMACDVAAIEGGKRVVMRGTLPRIIDHITEAETDRPAHSAPPVTRIALRCTVASWVRILDNCSQCSSDRAVELFCALRRLSSTRAHCWSTLGFTASGLNCTSTACCSAPDVPLHACVRLRTAG